MTIPAPPTPALPTPEPPLGEASAAEPLVASRPERPAASNPGVRRRMQATGHRDTAPELALRLELHRRGLRYRVEVKLSLLPRRRMDIVFTRAKLVVLVDGCFWHSCPLHGTTARANAGYWATKLATNIARDRDTDTVLTAAGWTVVRVWEHELPYEAAERVQAQLRRLMARHELPVERSSGSSG